MEQHVEKIERGFKDDTREKFLEKVEEGKKFLKQQIKDGELENQDFTIGLELELYAVDEEGRITPIPKEIIEEKPVNPELGLQNAEINTEPEIFSPEGVEKQRKDIEAKFEKADSELKKERYRLVLDSIPAIPHGDSYGYLTEHTEEDDYIFPFNMKGATRYHAIDNAVIEKNGGEIEFEVPGAELEFPSILFECLATSIQPHLQVPDTEDFPDYYNYGTRTMAPLLALSANSPFLPADLYNQVEDTEQLVDETFHELRIPIFEQSVNTQEEYSEKKVRVPDDIDSTEEVVEKVGEDEVYAPSLQEWEDEEEDDYSSGFWELGYKRGTYWRWVRPVFEATPVEGGNDKKAIRIEYRPIPTQPSIKDIVSMQVLTNGLLHGLHEEDHPLNDLDWETAKKSFYDVVENGLDADIEWINREGDRTTDKEEIFEEVFSLAEKGLEKRGFTDEDIEKHLGPIKKRWEKRTSPSAWKKDRVKENLESGASFEEAVRKMQKEYNRNSREMERFSDWL